MTYEVVAGKHGTAGDGMGTAREDLFFDSGARVVYEFFGAVCSRMQMQAGGGRWNDGECITLAT